MLFCLWLVYPSFLYFDGVTYDILGYFIQQMPLYPYIKQDY